MNFKENNAKDVVFAVDSNYQNLDKTIRNTSDDTRKAAENAGILGTAIGNLPTRKQINIDTKFNEPDMEKLKQAVNKLKSGLTGTGVYTVLGLDKIKLARGGIVNNPGKGVPISNNIIAGEKDQEAVLPLTEETLSMLGQFIGRHITIENIIDNNIDGRRLNRILKTSNGITNFARNGG